MPKLTALGHIGLAVETVFGTAVTTPVVYVPYDSIKVEDDIKKIHDEGRRANLTKVFNSYDATRHGKVEFGGHAYPELLGYFFRAILGAATVVGASAPYTHTFKVVNALAPSWTLSDNNTISQRNYPGAVMSELDLKFDAESDLKYTVKYQSKSSASTTTKTPAFAFTDPFMGTALTLTLNGTANTNLMGGDLKFKRDVKMLFTASGSPDPSKASSGRISVEGKLTFDIEDESEWTLFSTSVEPIVVLTFAKDVSTSLVITLSKVDIKKAHIDRSQEYLRVDMEIEGLYNTTDSGNVAVVLKNSIAAY
jgi:hypothetical protein